MNFFQRINKLFLLTVAIPTTLAVIYYGFIASAVYTSESRFVVRSQAKQNAASPLLGILSGSGFTSSNDDSFTIQSFILSRDALHALDKQFHIKDAYSESSIDFLKRFPGPLSWDNSFEHFYYYYRKMVYASYDPGTSITTLTTHAFDPKVAWEINNRLLDLSENLVNKLNERGRQDLIHYSLKEVAEMEKKAKFAALALANYRNEKGVIDPEKQSAIPLQQVANLQDELLMTKTQIMQLEKLAKNNPRLPVLKQRAHLLEDQIKIENLRVAGSGKWSLAGKAAEYQQLMLEKEFADKMLASAMGSLEQARKEAQRKQLYLELIAHPNDPDSATAPQRLRIIISVFGLGMITWGVVTMLIAGIKDHLD